MPLDGHFSTGVPMVVLDEGLESLGTRLAFEAYFDFDSVDGTSILAEAGYSKDESDCLSLGLEKTSSSYDPSGGVCVPPPMLCSP
jgi:hypothetical protein